MSSDGLFDNYFSGFTQDDFKKIDEAVAAVWEEGRRFGDDSASSGSDESEFPSEIDGLNLNLFTDEEWAKLDNLPDIEQYVSGDNEEPIDTSFASEINLRILTEEDFQRLDAFTYSSSAAGEPSIPIALEVSSGSPGTQTMRVKNLKSPLRQFRRQGVLSVTDLCHPTWCEVQFDYGLRGNRSRPINKRPVSFKSASGKNISVEKNVAQKNDIRTKQGLVVHKELQREIRAKELEVDITSKETKWALKIVNMLACLKELIHGPRNMTREMPVFGILQNEVVVGIIDEVVSERSVNCMTRKRKAKGETSKSPPKKRSGSKLPDENTECEIDSIYDPKSHCEEPRTTYTLRLRDAKTRHRPWIPDHKDTLAGRLQVHIYFTLLENLISREPPFAFDLLWKKLDVNPDAKLPTKFLVQAQLITNNEDFELVSLNDLVVSFFKLINNDTMHVSSTLELVYYLRPSTESRTSEQVEQDISENKPSSSQKVIASSCDHLPAKDGMIPNKVGTSQQPDIVEPGHDIISAKQLQLERHDDVDREKEEGIRRFPLIGKETFIYNKKEMDMHVHRILEWWRGERPPKGVPIHLTTRCRTCEYANDCEWRAAKALELGKPTRLETSSN